jgi:DNA primase
MEKENLSFPEALKHLAERFHIQLPQLSKLSPQVLKLEEKLFKINESALGFYRKNLLNTREGQIGLDYLKKRKISDKTIQDLKIGYALNSWNSLLSFFQGKNVSPALLEKAGLAIPGQKKDEFYDRFRGRIIFPIFSLTGKVVGFGGRTITNAEPKYLNSPDTPLYSKGKLLYGLNFTKDAIRDKGEVVLVEGYTDFSALYQAGISNVAASLGTALTPFQVALAQRFAPRMVINYDGDQAGRAAALRAIPICFEKGVYTRVLILPEDLDPDAVIKKYGVEHYQALVKKSIPGLKFLIDGFRKEGRMDIPEEMAKIIRNIVREVEKMPDSVVRSEYLKKTSDYLGVPEELIRNVSKQGPQDSVSEEREFFLPAEKRLLQILLENELLASDIFSELKEEDLRGLKGEPVFMVILERFKNNKGCGFHELCEAMGTAFTSHISKALLEKTRPATLEEAMDCLTSLRKITLQNRLKELQAEITRLEKKGEKDKLSALLFLRQDITKQIISL